MNSIIKDDFKKRLQENISSYPEAKIHSAKLDLDFGFDCENIESQLIKDNDHDRVLWIGLDLQVLQTPYSEILAMLTHANLKDGEHAIDLGAGYGRMGMVIGYLFPTLKFTGFEFVNERVLDGNKIYAQHEIRNSKMIYADLAADEFQIPDADLYFIYDFGSKKDVYVALEKLRVKAQSKNIQVIARGGGVRNWIIQDFPWLSQMVPYDRFEHWTLFRS